MIHDGDAVAHLLDLAQEMRVEEHRGAARGKAANDLAHVVAADRVQCGRGLVEKHELGLAEQGGAEAEALLHSFRERAHAGVAAVGEADRFERVRDLLPPRRTFERCQLAVEGEDLARGQPALVAEKLRQVADALSCFEVPDGFSQQPRLS